MKYGSRLFRAFLESEKTGGVILIACTMVSLIFANSAVGEHYLQIWDAQIGNHSVLYWINDALMVIFFLMIGLELKREIFLGELSTPQKALLPLLAALGGVIVPALFYSAFNLNTPTQAGAGIPMATDIAFALGVLSLLGKRVPLNAKIFLTALAVIDDLCAIIVIAIFYTSNISFLHLGFSLSIFALLGICNRLKIHNLLPYAIGGIGMWYFMVLSGVHATISGVLLAFVIPFGKGSRKALSYKLQSFLHIPVSFLILPLFALANTALIIEANWYQGLMEPIGMGIILGLVLGKPLGIFFTSFLFVKLKFCKLPQHLQWKHILGVGLLAGIGFTMSIFISFLAFEEAAYISNAKIAILVASFTAAVIGLIYLNFTLPKKELKKIQDE